MLKRSQIIFLLLFALASPSAYGQVLAPKQAHEPTRKVAVTIDDLPATALMGDQKCDSDYQLVINRLLIQKLVARGVPAIGFVNEGRPYCESIGEPFVREVLTMWLDAGLELGNHSYSHGSLEKVPVEEFKADVIRGEQVTKELLREHGRQLRYFRHPYLDTGADDSTKAAFEHFLKGRGYTTAPVTIDNGEWTFAAAYSKAVARADSAEMKRIGRAYLDYMETVFVFYEELSRNLLGYELPQVLLIHANALNGDYFDELAGMIARRGYTFVTLAEALEDPAYERGDTYTGARGLSWLQRWLVDEGKETRKEPPVPAWVSDALNN